MLLYGLYGATTNKGAAATVYIRGMRHYSTVVLKQWAPVGSDT